MKKGFTLIELLVVVLIIGILSSVALPQYSKAVNKAKAVEAWTTIKAVDDAQGVYFLSNGTYATEFDELDIEIPEMKNWHSVSFYGTNNMFFLILSGKGGLGKYKISFFRYVNGEHQTKIHCEGDQKNCKNMIPCVDIGTNGGAICYS
ncbi:MAG: prepilin-type N-terminal cleavage/methylation domain-containing protein [Elusimicrobiaceae bacterium]|nr:prepilin-type N-terminal cleavage/methylation domain-containing protein [Elusimicrobiaceae bacterium]